jgi:hypothetical protein
MRKWEYCQVTRILPSASLAFMTPKGNEQIAVKKGMFEEWNDAIFRTLAQLGLEGWELVGYTAGNSWSAYVLKRPME